MVDLLHFLYTLIAVMLVSYFTFRILSSQKCLSEGYYQAKSGHFLCTFLMLFMLAHPLIFYHSYALLIRSSTYHRNLVVWVAVLKERGGRIMYIKEVQGSNLYCICNCRLKNKLSLPDLTDALTC